MANTVELVFGADQARTTSQVISDLQKIAKSVEASGATKLKFSIDTNSLKSSVTTLQQAKIATQEVKTATAQAVGQEQIATAAHKTETAAINEQTAKLRLKRAEQSAAEVQDRKDAAAIQKSTNMHLQLTKVLDQERDYYARNASAIKTNSEINSKWQESLTKLGQDENSFGNQTQTRAYFADLERQTREAGLQVQTLGDKIKNLFQQHLGTAAVMVGIHALVQLLQQTYQNVVELDKAVVNLQVATGYSREQTQALIGDYSKYAKELGATTTQVADAANDWLNNIGQVKSL